MFSGLNVFKMAHAMAAYTEQRQAVVARNIANSDTPGYRAQDIEPFEQLYRYGEMRPEMRASRNGHLNFSAATELEFPISTSTTAMDPNRNSVSLEQEMVKAVETQRQHDRAIAIYRSTLNVIRASLGR